jgi:hypothetical protein
MEDEGILAIARMLLEQAKAERRNFAGSQVFLGATTLVAGLVGRSYGFPGALFTVGAALVLSGVIEFFRLLRLESAAQAL